MDSNPKALFFCHPDRAIATRDLYDSINEILPPYGRQNDRVEDSPPDKNQKYRRVSDDPTTLVNEREDASG
ncbi:MAG: hypothetical protein J6J76_03855 [Paraprevotella sp.]|nr:hypothetical protein [Paraprevotella sp.]